MRASLVLILVTLTLALGGCSSLPDASHAGKRPLLSVSQTSAHPSRAVIVIPGALASIRLYRDVFEWDLPDTEFLGYRFPGFDGLALDHRVSIEDAGRLIAEHVAREGYKDVWLIGYSTGGPVALEAAMHMDPDARDIKVALLSTAAPAPAAFASGLNGIGDLFAAATRAQSLKEDDLWAENFRTLLFGRNHYSDPRLAAISDRYAHAVKGHLATPKEGLGAAHAAGLISWHPSAPEKLAHVRVGFFHGTQDPVFSPRAIRRFAATIPGATIETYHPGGHLLFVTHPCVLPDMLAMFTGTPQKGPRCIWR